MDDVTQQNAALVEEAAAAAESLQEQAQHLADAMAVFTLNAEQGPGTQSAGDAAKTVVRQAPRAPSSSAVVRATPKAAVKPVPKATTVAGRSDEEWTEF
jgi:hypothetical protein